MDYLRQCKASKLTAERLRISDMIQEEETRLENRLKPYKEAIKKLDAELIRRMAEEEVTRFDSSIGGLSRVKRERYYISDYERFIKYVASKKRYDFFATKVADKVIKEYRELEEDLPPGIGVTTAYTLRKVK